MHVLLNSCFLGIGANFLKNVFQVYDGNFGKGPARIGFALLKGASGQTIATTQNAIPFTGPQTANVQLAPTPTRRPGPPPPPAARPTHSAAVAGVEGAAGLPLPVVGTAVPQALPLIAAGNNYPDLDKLTANADGGNVGTTRSSGNAAAALRMGSDSSFLLAALGVAAALVAFL